MAYNRLLISLWYKAGEITAEEAVDLGGHKDLAAFQKFTESAVSRARDQQLRGTLKETMKVK